MSENKKHLEASVALVETSLWIAALGEDAATQEEVADLLHTLKAEVDVFREDSPHPVPLITRRAVEILQARSEALDLEDFPPTG